MSWGKISPKLVLHNYKSISSDKGTCCCNIYIPGRCTRNIFICVQILGFCPCYMSPLHIPATCRLSVYYTSFLSLQHAAATCPCNLILRVCPHLRSVRTCRCNMSQMSLQHVAATNHSLCTGRATSCCNSSWRHVAVIRRFRIRGNVN